MEKAVEDIPVRIFLFDMLYCDGEDYTLKPYSFRRMRLESSFKDDDSERYDRIGYTSRAIIDSDEKAQKFFDGAIAARCEGIMAKSLSEDSVYRAGSRGFLWIKYKKDYTQALVDSFDLTVVGAFCGMGKRAGKYGALLMAAYDPDTGRFGTACKLGTGFAWPSGEVQVRDEARIPGCGDGPGRVVHPRGRPGGDGCGHQPEPHTHHSLRDC